MSAALLVRLLFWLWFGAALYAGHDLLLLRLPGPAMPALLLMLAALVLMLSLRVGALHAWLSALPLRTLVLFHLLRLADVAFLVAQQRGELPFAFAAPTGIGDVAIALFALPVALAPLEPSQRHRAIMIWNIAGLTTTLLAVVSLFRFAGSEPGTLLGLTSLPLCLWPLFLAPLLLASHVLILMRLARPDARLPGA